MKGIYRFLFFLLPILIVGSAFKMRQSYPEQIAWDSHFIGEADEHSPYAALTTTIWQYSYQARTKGKQLHIDFKFVAGVDREKSWVKHYRIRNKEVNKQLLNHEQGHVDINFILLKQGELTLRNQNYTVNNYKNLIQLNAKKISKHFSDLQSRYDKETKHGADLAAQKVWDNYIRAEMKKY